MALYTIEKVLEGIEMFGSSPKERITNSVNLWNSISSVLFPSAQSNDPVPLLATEVINSQPSLLESIRSIKKSPMLGHRLLKEYQRHLLQRFNFKTLPLIDQKLSEENTSNVNNTEAFCYAITLLYSNAKVIYSWLDIFEVSEGIRNSFLSKIRGQCQSALTPLLLEHARIFFGNLTLYLEPPLSIEDYRSIFFKLLPGKDGELLLSFLTTPPPVCSSKECIIIHQLSETGILELLEPFLIKVARQRISEFTRKLDPADSQLQSALNWFHHLLFPTIAYCLQSIDLKTVYQRLITDLFESIIQNSADTIFDIILNQENFHDAIIGIKLCLKATNHYSLFVRRVQLQLKQRLLHPGARTIDIILFFVATIKLFRILDPSGLLLSECTKELCDYIRTQRKDTVKSMVQILFDSSRRLKNELAGEKIVFPRQEPVLKVSDQVDFEYCWQPAKFSSETLNPSPILPSADILSILVSVYQSKDAFIREYQLSMSEALMKKIGFQVHDFIEDIEQLKARFGECSLNACDAMIRDVKESYRLNKMAHAQFSETSPLEVLIISHLFWPSLEFTSFTLHPNIQRLLDKFSSFFQKVRMSRNLQWLSNYGLVELEIMLDHETTPHEISCTPLQASVLLYFTTSPKWVEYDLIIKSGLSGPLLQLALQFWCHLGFLKYIKSTQQWQILHSRKNPLINDITEMDLDKNAPPLTAVNNPHLIMYKNYIQTSLMLQPMTLDRIHARLTLVVMHQQKPNLHTVKLLLNEMIQQGTVELLSDGRYSNRN